MPDRHQFRHAARRLLLEQGDRIGPTRRGRPTLVSGARRAPPRFTAVLGPSGEIAGHRWKLVGCVLISDSGLRGHFRKLPSVGDSEATGGSISRVAAVEVRSCMA